MIGILRDADRENGSDLAGERQADSTVTPARDHSKINPVLIPTRESLLSRLKETSADESWREFFDTYWRLIYHNARKAGLSDEDGQEVVQEVLNVLRAVPGQQPRTREHVLILKAERRRNDRLKLRRTEPLDETEGRSTARAQSRNEDIGVDDNAHADEASDSLFPSKA